MDLRWEQLLFGQKCRLDIRFYQSSNLFFYLSILQFRSKSKTSFHQARQNYSKQLRSLIFTNYQFILRFFFGFGQFKLLLEVNYVLTIQVQKLQQIVKITYQMKQSRKIRQLYIQTKEQNQEESSEDDQFIQQYEVNDFQNKNKIYELQSTIHNLSIEKQQIALTYKNILDQEKNKTQQLALTNGQLNQQNKKLKDVINQLRKENQQLKQQYSIRNGQFDTNSPRYRQHDRENSYSSTMFKQLQNKNQTIRSQQKQIQSLKQQKSGFLRSQSYAQLHRLKQQQTKSIKRQLEEAMSKIQSFRRHETELKRQYTQMLQSKEQIIKKLTLQNEDHTKNLLYSREKMNYELKRQIQELIESNNQKKQEIKLLNDKNYALEMQLVKSKRELKKKDNEMQHHCEIQKTSILKEYDERIKTYLREKEDRIQHMQEDRNVLETELANLRAQELKYKTQIASMSQLIDYLQKVNKQQDYNKKKLQETINEKDRQIGTIKQQSFKQVNELKITISNLKKQSQEQQIQKQQALKEKNFIIQKLQKKMKTLDNYESGVKNSFQSQVHRSIDSLKFENVQLNDNVNKWIKKYQAKCEQAQIAQSRLKKNYEEKLGNLEMQIKDQKFKNIQIKAIQTTYDQQIRQQIDKIRISKQMLEIQKVQHLQQINRLRKKLYEMQQQNIDMEDTYRKLVKQCHEKRQDYNSLKHQYDRLEDQSKITVKNLQKKLRQYSQAIHKEQKRNERKSTSLSKDNEDKMLAEIKRLKAFNQQLKDQLQQLKQYNKIADTDIGEKLKDLAHEITILRERQIKAKNIEASYKKQHKKLENQIQRLNEIIRQLQQKQVKQQSRKRKVDSSCLTPAHPQAHQLENQNLKLRIQYSQTLKQLNILLQKHKTLEDTHKQCSERQDFTRQKMQNLQLKYRQLTIQRNQKAAELDNAYGQLGKIHGSQQVKSTQRKLTKAIDIQSPIVSQFNYVKKGAIKSPSLRASHANDKQKSFQAYKKATTDKKEEVGKNIK